MDHSGRCGAGGDPRAAGRVRRGAAESWALDVDSDGRAGRAGPASSRSSTTPRRRSCETRAPAPMHQFLTEVAWDIGGLGAAGLAGAQPRRDAPSTTCPDEEPQPDEIAFLTAIADQAAAAVENHRLVALGRNSAALQERQRLARELHDSVSQALFSMTLHARSAQLALASGPTCLPTGRWDGRSGSCGSSPRGRSPRCARSSSSCVPARWPRRGSSRRSASRPRALSAREGLPVTVTGPPERLGLAADVEEHLYRIVLEALHNTVKHAPREPRLGDSVSGAEPGSGCGERRRRGLRPGSDLRRTPRSDHHGRTARPRSAGA